MQKPNQLSWADLAQAQEDHEYSHHCKLEYALHCYRPVRTSPRLVWTVTAFARRKAGRADELRGTGTAKLGGNTGSRTMPGAILRAMMEACSDLEKRADSKAYDRDNPAPRLPGM